MRAQSIKEMLAIALPFALAVMGFVILMGGFFEMSVKIGEAFIPHKVASMVLHTLTGSKDCLTLATALPHKGLLDINKIPDSTSTQMECAIVPCWRWRAKVKIFKSGATETRSFGDDSTSDSIWGGTTRSETITNDLGFSEDHYAPMLTSRKMPVVVQDGGEKYFGTIEVQVATKHPSTCSDELDALITSTVWAEAP